MASTINTGCFSTEGSFSMKSCILLIVEIYENLKNIKKMLAQKWIYSLNEKNRDLNL